MWLPAVTGPTLLVLSVAVTVHVAVADLPPGNGPRRHPISWADHAPHLAQQLRDFAGGAARVDTATVARQLLRHGDIAESPWSEQSPSERTQQLQLHLGERGQRYRAKRRASQHRRMQTTTQEKDASIATYLNDTERVLCTDPLATNNGATSGCAYDCQALQDEFFPGEESRCFIYDAASATWPQELLNLRQRYNINGHTFLNSSDDGTRELSEGMNFSVGAGRQCRNVTVRTTLFGSDETHTEVRCLLDGEHEYNHTVTTNHSVEVVGYAQSAVHSSVGESTPFVIGECTDVLVRVTTMVSAGPMTWRLDDGGHNGPWDFNVSGEVGVHELESCMFDNDYALVRQGGTGWQGSVEVIGFIHFHNTIVIPNDENWIIQGGIDAATGLPASLDGRLSAGTPLSPSQSSIVLRDMRFSDQTAPVDPYPEWRNLGFCSMPNAALGGAFAYTGGSDDPSNLPRLIFERVIFDHNSASSGAAVFIDGRAGQPVPTDPSQTNWDGGISWTMRGCTFFRNQATMCSAIAATNVWPQQFLFEDVNYIQNMGLLCQHELYSISQLDEIGTPDRRRIGQSWLHRKRSHYDGGWSTEGLVGMMPSTYASVDTSDDPQAVMNATLEEVTAVDHGTVVWGMVFVVGIFPPRPDMAFRCNLHLIDLNLAETVALTAGDTWDSAFFEDIAIHTLVERSRFENNGPIVQGSIGMGGWSIYRAQSVLPENRPTVRFVNTEFIQNRAAHGGAVGVIDGVVDLSFDTCILRGNTATGTGGSISFGATRSSRLLVERSIFESNAISLLQSDEATTAAVVMLNTGGLGDGSQDVNGKYHTLVWRIDDGPVYGVPWEMCEAAKQYSVDAVAQGFSETWPTDLDCANVTYHTQTTYSQVVLVTNGVHTLWHGVITQSAQIVTTWKTGYIEVAGAVGRVLPTFKDYRGDHFPNCDHVGTCGTAESGEPADCPQSPGDAPSSSPAECCCKSNVAIWSSTDFFVSTGGGGAIDATGPVHVAISDSEFRNNDAPQGATLRISSTLSARITSTSIDEPVDEWSSAVSVQAAEVATCVDNPCATGDRCTFTYPSTSCEACGPTEVGLDGISCVECLAGKTPNENHTECVDCVGNTYSILGLCQACDGIVDPDHRSCTTCPTGQEPDDSGLNCRCSVGKFNTSQKTQCYTRDWHAAMLPMDVQCLSCDAYLSDCVDACATNASVKPGWSTVARTDGTTSIFQCRHELACSGLACNEGYAGTLCGICNEGYKQDSDGECTVCDETTASGIAIVVVLVLVTVLLLTNIDKWYESVAAIKDFTIKEVVTLARHLELQSLSKILVATMQIITNLTEVLSIPFPDAFRALLKALAIFRFDISLTLGIGCWYHNSYFTTLGASFIIVFVAVLIVGAIYLHSLSRATDESQLRKFYTEFDKAEPEEPGITVRQVKAMAEELQLEVSDDEIDSMFAQADTDNNHRMTFDEFCSAFDERLAIRDVLEQTHQAKLLRATVARLFLLVFLVYPTLTNKIFEIFLCRDLGPNTSPRSILQVDYGVDCDDTQAFRWTLGVALVILWPIAIPVALFGTMFRVSPKILAGDEQVTDMYSFIIGDYQRKYWYWEVVELVRKLLLSGILSLVNRGSIAQATLGTMITFVFFGLHVRLQPYKSTILNTAKTVTEIQLFVVLLVSIILQHHNVSFDMEVIQVDTYGMIQTVATVLIGPVIVALMVYNLKELHLGKDKHAQPRTEEIEMANPLGQSDATN